jgi:MEDS: MEthanogen/methylotroph, DcmR Sensory domain
MTTVRAPCCGSWLSDPAAVEFIGDESLYAKPARAIAAYRRLFEFHVATGAGQIRIAGDVPHPGNGRRFEGWDRYEAAVNIVWQEFPVWGRCLYGTTTVPAVVLDAVERTHSRIVSPSGQRRESSRYQDARAFEGLPRACREPGTAWRAAARSGAADPAAGRPLFKIASGAAWP